jgi:general stress protein 26
MDTQPQSSDGMRKLAELVEETSIGMLTTVQPDGSLRSRPLATRQFDSEGNLWFFTSLSSPKVREIEEHPQVNLSYADPRRSDYVSISGTASVVRDRAKMQELWTTWAKPWFPHGLDDPDLVLLRVAVEAAEYWDSPSSSVVQLLGLARAMATGAGDAVGEHAKMRVPRRPNA